MASNHNFFRQKAHVVSEVEAARAGFIRLEEVDRVLNELAKLEQQRPKIRFVELQDKQPTGRYCLKYYSLNPSQSKYIEHFLLKASDLPCVRRQHQYIFLLCHFFLLILPPFPAH